MKVLILYRPKSEHATAVESFKRDFQRLHGNITVEEVNLDTREGAALASLYDVVAYPGIVAQKQDGVALQVWQGAQLPLMDEVASYAV